MNLLLLGLSPWGIGTGSGGRVFRGLGAGITGQNHDGKDWDITIKPRDGEMKLSNSCIYEIKI
jgi:hypothetical protein